MVLNLKVKNYRKFINNYKLSSFRNKLKVKRYVNYFKLESLIINKLPEDKIISKTNNILTKTKKNPMKSFLLYQLDLWSYRTIGIGFPFLTLGIISGAVWANEAWGSYWSWDPKETWALITWIVFAVYLHARLIRNSNEKESALLGSVGFFVIWICYLGVNFLGQGLHSYGWLS